MKIGEKKKTRQMPRLVAQDSLQSEAISLSEKLKQTEGKVKSQAGLLSETVFK